MKAPSAVLSIYTLPIWLYLLLNCSVLTHQSKSSGFRKTNDSLSNKIGEFWQDTERQLKQEPIQSVVEARRDPLPYKVFSVTLTSLGGVRIRALLSLPIEGESLDKTKRWPVIVTVPGYGGSQQGVMLSECQRGYAVLQVFPRGQGESSLFLNITQDEKLTMHTEQPQGMYYQGCYADVMRAIDFAVSRPDIDTNRIALVGTSQGGRISLAVGALDSRVKVVVAHVPFLCNFRLAATIPGSLVKLLLDKAGKNNEQTLSTLDYFDPSQLADRFHKPVLLSAGGKDNTCPEATIQSFFERVKSKKQLKTYPNLPHTTCLDFYNLSWKWLDSHL